MPPRGRLHARARCRPVAAVGTDPDARGAAAPSQDPGLGKRLGRGDRLGKRDKSRSRHACRRSCRRHGTGGHIDACVDAGRHRRSDSSFEFRTRLSEGDYEVVAAVGTIEAGFARIRVKGTPGDQAFTVALEPRTGIVSDSELHYDVPPALPPRNSSRIRMNPDSLRSPHRRHRALGGLPTRIE